MQYRHYEVTQQGNLLKVKQLDLNPVTKEAYPTRGEITNFSRKSRVRLIEHFARFDQAKMGAKKTLFITLTYDRLMLDYHRAKRDLKVFMEAIQERFPRSWIAWRMETQRSGSIHFHILLGKAGFWDVTEAQEVWNRIAGGNAGNSLDLRVIDTYRGVTRYVSKYVAKSPETNLNASQLRFKAMLAVLITHRTRPVMAFLLGLSMLHIFSASNRWTGRHWGFYGRKYLPYGKVRTAVLSGSDYAYMCGIAEMDSEYASFWQNWTLFDDNAKQKFDRLCWEMWEQPNHMKAREHYSKQKWAARMRFREYLQQCVNRANEKTANRKREMLIAASLAADGKSDETIAITMFVWSLPEWAKMLMQSDRDWSQDKREYPRAHWSHVPLDHKSPLAGWTFK